MYEVSNTVEPNGHSLCSPFWRTSFFNLWNSNELSKPHLCQPLKTQMYFLRSLNAPKQHWLPPTWGRLPVMDQSSENISSVVWKGRRRHRDVWQQAQLAPCADEIAQLSKWQIAIVASHIEFTHVRLVTQLEHIFLT